MSGTAKKGIKARLISWAMRKMMAGAGGPPGSGGGGPPPWVKAMMAGGGNQSMAAMLATSSGFEGREKLLGDAVSMALRTLDDHTPYPHDMNDALVKMHLSSVQFAKDNGRIADYVAHDVKTMTAHFDLQSATRRAHASLATATYQLVTRDRDCREACDVFERGFDQARRLQLVSPARCTEEYESELWSKTEYQGDNAKKRAACRRDT